MRFKKSLLVLRGDEIAKTSARHPGVNGIARTRSREADSAAPPRWILKFALANEVSLPPYPYLHQDTNLAA